MENNYNWEAFMEHAEEVRKSYWEEAYAWLKEFEKTSQEEHN